MCHRRIRIRRIRRWHRLPFSLPSFLLFVFLEGVVLHLRDVEAGHGEARGEGARVLGDAHYRLVAVELRHKVHELLAAHLINKNI